MATYIPSISGFLIDTPELDIIRCDGRKFSFKNVKTANFTNTNNIMEITGGWSQYPLAYIDTTKVLELAFSSADFSMDMFEMANDTELVATTDPVLKSALFEVDEDLVVTIPEAYAKTPELMVYVNGFTTLSSTGESATGKIVVGSVAGSPGTTTLTFFTGDVAVGDTILVSYMHVPVDAQAIHVETNSSAARVELFAHYPIYSSGTDCSDASIKGYLTLRIYRARVTEMPAFDSSYKSEANPALRFSAIDPKRSDKRMFSLTYEPVA